MAFVVGVIFLALAIYFVQLFLAFKSTKSTYYLPTKVVVHELVKITAQPRVDRFNKVLYVQISMESLQNPEFKDFLITDSVSIEIDDDVFLPSEWSEAANSDVLKQGVLTFNSFNFSEGTLTLIVYMYDNVQLKWEL